MGRLTDNLMAAIGMKPSDRVPLDHGETTNNKQPGSCDKHSDKAATPSTSEISETKEDCLECKIVASSTVAVLSGLVAYLAWKPPYKFTGRKLIAWRMQGMLSSASKFHIKHLGASEYIVIAHLFMHSLELGVLIYIRVYIRFLA